VDLAFALAAEHWPEEDPDDAWQQAEVALKVLSRSTPYLGRVHPDIQPVHPVFSTFLGYRWLRRL